MSPRTPIPFSEPPYLAGLPSPYYNESHRRWQKACRAFVEKNLIKHAMEWERDETVPTDVFEKFAKANMLVPSLPAPLPIEWLKRLGIHEMLGGLKVEEWDYLHTAIYTDEVGLPSLGREKSSLTLHRWRDLD
jgi:acyl-CoA dehydrogenase